MIARWNPKSQSLSEVIQRYMNRGYLAEMMMFVSSSSSNNCCESSSGPGLGKFSYGSSGEDSGLGFAESATPTFVDRLTRSKYFAVSFVEFVFICIRKNTHEFRGPGQANIMRFR